MKTLKELMLTVLIFANSVCVRAGEPNIRDFMVMDVCTDKEGHLDPKYIPGMENCLHARNVLPGESLPYSLHDYPSASNESCKRRLGSISKDNIPVIKNGVERIISFYDRGVDESCVDVNVNDPRFGKFDGENKEGGSVQWYDSEYGFIMGSWSTTALSYWRTPECEDQTAASRRFFRGWIIGPTKLPHRSGGAGYGMFKSKLERGSANTAEMGCPKNFSSQFTSWIRDDFVFKSGHTMDALISDHYSRSSLDGLTPGPSMQVERTYWTNEFGLTRWEKWAREDWVHPRNSRTAKDLGISQFQAASCSTPYVKPRSITKSFFVEKSDDVSVYTDARWDMGTKQKYKWYMTLCRDYTNTVFRNIKDLVPAWGEAIPDAFWHEK